KGKKELYEAALAAAGVKADGEDSSGATTARKKASPKKKAEEPKAAAEVPKADEPKVEESPAVDEVAAVSEEPATEPTPADTDGGEASADGVKTDADAPAEDKA